MSINNINNLINQTIPEIENEVQKFWKENKIFDKTQQSRVGSKKFRFVDGPPFPNDIPHYGHLLCSVAKDVIPRYKVMKGYDVRRVFGWDCHGLAIEEKLNDKLGIKGSESKKLIENELGVKNYIEKCRELVGTNIEAWRLYMDRIGRWSDMDNAYKTMDQEFGESVIWAFKQLWDKGLIYKGRRTSLYSTDSTTPVSEFEVNMDPDNYRETEDVSVYMAFELEKSELHTKYDLDKIFILSWTTTPWTLYANAALALNQNEKYLIVKNNNGDGVILAKERFENVKEIVKDKFENYKILAELVGSDLLGKKYNQLLTDIPSNSDNDFKIYHGDFVSMDDGTGIVHIAPSYGEDDANLGKLNELSNLESIDDSGHMLIGSQKDKYLRDANLDIAKELLVNHKVWKIKSYKHRLPYFRTNNPLIYKTLDAWFVNIQSLKPRMMELIDQTNWVPESIKNGRWKNTIESSPDWCLSRSRYWNTIMPMWVSDDGEILVIGSIDEMMQLSKNQIIKENNKYYFVGDNNKRLVTMHRDICDQIILYKDNKEFKRVEYVLDNWMDAGSVPFAEYHYPFENSEIFKEKPSADFIVEYVGQVRAWFNVLFRMSVGVFNEYAFDNVICTGVLAGNDGRKMSKSLKNYPDSMKMLEDVGGEAVRLFLMNSPLLIGGDAECKEEFIRDQVKVILLPFLNSFKYFELYAKDFKPDKTLISTNFSDKWILSKTNIFINSIDGNLEKYNIPDCIKLLQEFLNDLSTIYIKSNRDRFVNLDKNALNTLYYVLFNISKAVSPFIPFITEKFWQSLKKYDSSLELSVHMTLYPEADKTLIDTDVINKMSTVREIVNKGLKLREENKVPLKQVLSNINISGIDLNQDQIEIILNDLNIKSMTSNKTKELIIIDFEITEDLRKDGLKREFISFIMGERRNLKLEIGSEINLQYEASELLGKVISDNLAEFKSKLKIKNFEIISDLTNIKKFGEDILKYNIEIL